MSGCRLKVLGWPGSFAADLFSLYYHYQWSRNGQKCIFSLQYRVRMNPLALILSMLRLHSTHNLELQYITSIRKHSFWTPTLAWPMVWLHQSLSKSVYRAGPSILQSSQKQEQNNKCGEIQCWIAMTARGSRSWLVSFSKSTRSLQDFANMLKIWSCKNIKWAFIFILLIVCLKVFHTDCNKFPTDLHFFLKSHLNN